MVALQHLYRVSNIVPDCTILSSMFDVGVLTSTSKAMTRP